MSCTLEDGLEDVGVWFGHQGHQTLHHSIYGYGLWWKNECIQRELGISMIFSMAFAKWLRAYKKTCACV